LPEDACLAVLFLVSNAEHYRSIVGAPQEYIEANQEGFPANNARQASAPSVHNSSSKKD
jgi:hypothetical protein